MRQNVGTTDAYLRITAGLLLFGLGLRSRGRIAPLFLMAAGASKVAEGITRWCPVMEVLGKDTLEVMDKRAPEAVSPRFGQIERNPYRTLPDETALGEEPDPAEDLGAEKEEPRRVRRFRLRRRPAVNPGTRTLGSSNHQSPD